MTERKYKSFNGAKLDREIDQNEYMMLRNAKDLKKKMDELDIKIAKDWGRWVKQILTIALVFSFHISFTIRPIMYHTIKLIAF